MIPFIDCLPLPGNRLQARRRQETDSNENREIEPEADQPPPPQQQEVQPDVSNGFQEAVQHDMEDNGEGSEV